MLMMIDKYIRDKYTVNNKIGSGSFGEVYIVISKQNNNKLAAKVEDKKNNTKRLKDEYRIYRDINKNRFIDGIPKIYDFLETPKFNILVMELLGKDLDDLFYESNKKFEIETVLLLGIEIITLLEKMHNSGYIHRDIKPNNFMIGRGINKKKIYIVDFGLSKKFLVDGSHIPFRTDKSLTGTARYTSINVHMGMEPSRRDDLESVAYMLIYFLKGKLPWQGLKKQNGINHIESIGEVKLCTSIEKLCRNIPKCFAEYLNYCRHLKYDYKPDYNYLRNIFIKTANNYNLKLQYEWSK